MPAPVPEQHVATVRRFNRFYTQRIGVLQEHWRSPFSLTEARVLYELVHRGQATASEIAATLGLDAGYMSRMVRGFRTRGLIATERSKADARHILLTLTERGRKAFAPLDVFSNHQVAGMLEALPTVEQSRLVTAMTTVERLLSDTAEPGVPYILRPPQPGDLGWIVNRHGTLYAQEYGWDQRLEALCAEIVASFVRNFDEKRERCWIAERHGENVGTVMVVKDTQKVARLRLLLVEPQARGLGIGARLVEECIRFARQAGYRKMTLWTHTVLTAARHIYQQAGFQLVATDTHEEFGKKLVGETWDLVL